MAEAKAKAAAKPKAKPKTKEPEYRKPWPGAVLVKFLGRTRRTAPSPSQKSIEHCGTQGYGLRSPDEIFFVDKADAGRLVYKKLTNAEIQKMLPKESETKE